MQKFTMGCGIMCVKYFMYVFNFAFTLSGIGMIAVGIVLTLKVSTVSNYLDSKFSAPPVLLIVTGTIVFIIAFYGCIGAIRESSCMVTAFSALLVLLLIAGVAVAAVAFVFKDKGEEVLSAEFRNAVLNYGKIQVETEAVDAIQKNFQCCGAGGPGDYLNFPPPSIPQSCCVSSEDTCKDLNDAHQVYQSGCVVQMERFVKNLGSLVGALAVGASVMMIIGIVFGFYLASSIRKKEKGHFF